MEDDYCLNINSSLSDPWLSGLLRVSEKGSHHITTYTECFCTIKWNDESHWMKTEQNITFFLKQAYQSVYLNIFYPISEQI